MYNYEHIEKYLGEARVVTGDKAVVFACTVYTHSQTADNKNEYDTKSLYCYKYISTGSGGQVATVINTCKPDSNSGSLQKWI